MKKMFAFVWIFLSSVIFAAGNNWYISNVSSGNANGDSWSNKGKFSTFNWASVQPGDVVYIDGGATDSSIDYSLTNITLTTKGTLANPITITNGIDAGHNGQVILKKTASADNLFTFDSGCYYTIINGLKIYGSPTHVNDYAVMTFYNNTHGITFQNCYIDIRNSYEGIRCESSASATNIKFLNCTVISSVTTSTGSADLFWLGGVNSTNWEIGWCNLITKTVSSGAHRDIIQVAWGFNNVGGGATPGYFKLHDSFIEDRSAGASGGGIESEHLGGKMLIYNNVFKSNCTGYGGTGAFSLLQLTSNRLSDGNGMPTNTGKVTARIYNNTFYASTNYVSTLAVRGFDSLFVQNNIFYSPTSGSSRYYIESDKYTQTHYQLWDYNQYTNGIGNQVMGEECDASAGIACGGQTYTWTQWRNAGFDANSTYNTLTPTFINPSGLSGTDYALQSGSSGINSGASLSSWFTTDFSNVTRPQGASWDIGALEFVQGGGGDITPPQVVSASLTNSTTLVINFSEPLNNNTAQNKNNYSINNGISVSSAVLSGTQVTLTTSTHVTSAYRVTVNNVTDLAGNVMNPNYKTANYNYTAGDVTAPQVVSAALTNSTKLVINFSEALNSIAAQNKSNYLINGISVSSAVLSGTQVTLTTSIHVPGSYIITVNNVTDLAGNVVDPLHKSANYVSVYDNIAPYFTNLTVTTSKRIIVRFSEKLDPIKAKNRNNYSINYNIVISSAQLLPDSMSVRLSTSFISLNKDYTLTLTGITDRAGNISSPNPTSVIYRRSRTGTTSSIQNPIGNAISNNWDPNYLPEKAIDGNGMTNPDSRWMSNTTMPDTLDFDMGNIYTLDSLRVSFFQWDSDRLFKYSVYSSEDSLSWQPAVIDIWSDSSEWTDIEFDSSKARFVKLVLLESNQSQPASIWEIEFYGPEGITNTSNENEIPNSFTLAQNYPNPFNPSTNINYTIPEKSMVSLKIFNLLGAEIKELVNGEIEPGQYNVEFNASNLPSGIYFYRLETNSFVETKKMILLK